MFDSSKISKSVDNEGKRYCPELLELPDFLFPKSK